VLARSSITPRLAYNPLTLIAAGHAPADVTEVSYSSPYLDKIPHLTSKRAFSLSFFPLVFLSSSFFAFFR
jgi:hypothetical protein